MAVDVGVLGPLAIRGRWAGFWGTITGGGGLGVDLLRMQPVRLYATGMAGEVRCVGDADTPTCPHSPGASFAWYAGGGVEFEIVRPHRWSFGIELGRWFTQVGPTLDYKEQPSRTAVAALLRRYLGRR